MGSWDQLNFKKLTYLQLHDEYIQSWNNICDSWEESLTTTTSANIFNRYVIPIYQFPVTKIFSKHLPYDCPTRLSYCWNCAAVYNWHRTFLFRNWTWSTRSHRAGMCTKTTTYLPGWNKKHGTSQCLSLSAHVYQWSQSMFTECAVLCYRATQVSAHHQTSLWRKQ